MKASVVAALGMCAALFFATDAEAACSDGKNRRVRVINNTATTMRYLYGSNIGTNDWQEDVLGRRVLAPGETIVVNWDDGTCYCTFDFKAVFADGVEVVNRRYNVCTGTEWRIHD